MKIESGNVYRPSPSLLCHISEATTELGVPVVGTQGGENC